MKRSRAEIVELTREDLLVDYFDENAQPGKARHLDVRAEVLENGESRRVKVESLRLTLYHDDEGSP